MLKYLILIFPFFAFIDKCMSFPEDFIFSAATASYQVEGAWNSDGKGENIWDRLTHTKPQLFQNKDNGDVACNSYHFYKEDIQLLKYIGFKMYRFSISWARILPNGEITSINKDGVKYYENLIDELLKNGIEPMITMYHWDLPQRLQDMGGWVNPLIVDFIEDYADVLFELYGNKVKWWITINEPVEIVSGYKTTAKAPALDLDSPTNYIVGHNILRAHGRIFRLYDKKYRHKQNGKISLSLSSPYFTGETNSAEDIEAANRAMIFNLGWFAHPIYSQDGDYPKIMRETVDANSKKEGRNRSRLPTFTDEEKFSIRGSFDFFGLNHYSTRLTTSGKPPYNSISERDVNVSTRFDPKWPSSHATWLKVVPWGFRGLLMWIKEKYNNPPVFVTENGYCDEGELKDFKRINYHREYLLELKAAIKNYECNVIGYTVWSILDNFEWLDAYDYRFGLVHVDFNDTERKRVPKKSSEFFKELIKTKSVPDTIPIK